MDRLTGLAAAASALTVTGSVPTCVAELLHTGPLLRELLSVATHAPPRAIYLSASCLNDIQSVCAVAENAVAQLRTCHGSLMAHVTAQPPPAVVDATRVAARDTALAAAVQASSDLSRAVQEANLDELCAASKSTLRQLDSVWRQVQAATGAAATRSAGMVPQNDIPPWWKLQTLKP